MRNSVKIATVFVLFFLCSVLAVRRAVAGVPGDGVVYAVSTLAPAPQFGGSGMPIPTPSRGGSGMPIPTPSVARGGSGMPIPTPSVARGGSGMPIPTPSRGGSGMPIPTPGHN